MRILASLALALIAGTMLSGHGWQPYGDLASPSAALSSVTTYKSYSHATSGAASTHYMAGYYEAPAADSNLNEGSLTQTLGTANVSYAAHVFLVAKEAGAKDAGTCTVVVSGVSITDAGVRTGADSETIVADVTAESANNYSETTKKWLGQVTYTLTLGGGATTCNLDFNYGWTKYDDFGNRDFTLTDFECVGETAGADNDLEVELLHHNTSGWTYHATAFVPGNTAVVALSTLHSTDDKTAASSHYAVKRAGLSTVIDGSGSEGFIIRLTTTAANTIESGDCHVGGTFL